MATIAELKAVLSLDSAPFKAGASAITGATGGLERSLRGVNAELSSTHRLSMGLDSFFRGNFVNGISQIVGALKGIPSAAREAAMSIGSIGAAFAGGWKLGKWIDKKTGISGAIASDLVSTQLDDDKTGERLRAERRAREAPADAKRAKEAAAKDSAAKIAEKDRLDRPGRLESEATALAEMLAGQKTGLERLEAMWQISDEKINSEYMATTDKAVRGAIMKRWDAAKQIHEKEVAEFKKAEAEKRQVSERRYDEEYAAIQASGEKEVSEIIESGKNRIASLSGRGTKISAMASVGGMMGGERAGIGFADRQMQVAREGLRLQREIAISTRDTAQKLQELIESAKGATG